MEVREQPVDDAEAEARDDEQVGLAYDRRRVRVDLAARRGQSEVLERAHGGRPYSDHAPPGGPRRGDAPPGGAVDEEALGVEAVVVEPPLVQRTEGPEADVQRDRLDGHAGRGQRRVDGRREVQTRGGRRRRSHRPGVCRLVASAVGEAGADVGRQRGLPHVGEPGEDGPRTLIGEHPPPVAERLDAAQRPVWGAFGAQRLPGARAPAHQRLPSFVAAGGRRPLQEEDLDTAAGRAAEEGPRREDPRVVAHEHVAAAQQDGEVAEARVAQTAVGGDLGDVVQAAAAADGPGDTVVVVVPRHDQKARGIARLDGMLCDQLAGKLEVEVVQREVAGAHRVDLLARRWCHASHLLAAQPQ